MKRLLARLKKLVADRPNRYFFEKGASDRAIARAEAAVRLPIPDDYKLFLAHFNGGFISIVHNEPGDEYWDKESARWNSNCLFGTTQLVAEFKDQQCIWQLDLGWKGPWSYLPFGKTDGQEDLVFAPPGKGKKRPVLDAFHEVGPREWGQLYPSFASLLAAYLEGDGKINTVAPSPLR